MFPSMSDNRKWVSAPVPFKLFGNRRGLTDQQLAEDEGLADFVARFPDSFERSDTMAAWLFIEPDKPMPRYERKDADPT